MPIVTPGDLAKQLNLPSEVVGDDLLLLERKLAAAQNHVERLLGYRIEARYGGVDQEPIPPSLIEAVLSLAAWWYEQREAAAEIALREAPFGVAEVVREYREWTF